ncbi:hypothetical protein QHF83_29200 [Polyangium sp. 15x6]|nr:hypothetical protein [Polyangium sp. 15x6]MDI3287427.1 hypothetical protein [Polyangium sp. 15x6]
MERHPEPLVCGYNVHREADRKAMLEALGLTSIADLFSSIPQEVRLDRELRLPAPHNEWALGKDLRELAGRNASTRSHLSFLGGGIYELHIPAVVDRAEDEGFAGIYLTKVPAAPRFPTPGSSSLPSRGACAVRMTQPRRTRLLGISSPSRSSWMSGTKAAVAAVVAVPLDHSGAPASIHARTTDAESPHETGWPRPIGTV